MAGSLVLAAVVSSCECRPASLMRADEKLVAQMCSTVPSCVATCREGFEATGYETLVALGRIFTALSVFILLWWALINSGTLHASGGRLCVNVIGRRRVED